MFHLFYSIHKISIYSYDLMLAFNKVISYTFRFFTLTVMEYENTNKYKTCQLQIYQIHAINKTILIENKFLISPSYFFLYFNKMNFHISNNNIDYTQIYSTSAMPHTEL